MPGLVGILRRGVCQGTTAQLAQMLACMQREAFYTSGTYVNEQLGVWVGWTNRAGSFTDCMPVWNETNDIALIFTGEDFTDRAELARLRQRGHQFDMENATYLVHLYEDMGLQFLDSLNGRFSGVLVDLRQRQVMLFNDRYGAERLYYHANAERICFASEAKALLQAFPELRQVDLTGLAETFSCGCVLQNRTLFSQVALLPGGSLWTWCRAGQLTKRRYFDCAVWEQQPLLDAADYYARLKETFTEVLPRYLQGREQLAMSLTGGLDGRMIMAWANASPGQLPCYTFGGMYRDCNDVKIARQVATLCHQPHTTLTVGAQFFAEFPRLVEEAVYLSDGAMDVTGAVELYATRLARQIAPARLTGNYGSEILRGVVFFRPRHFDTALLAPEFAKMVQTAAQTYAYERQGHPVSFVAFKQVPWHNSSRLSVEPSQLTMRAPYLDNQLVALTYQASPQLLVSPEPSLHLIAEGNTGLAKIPTDRGLRYRPVPVLATCRHLYEQFTFKAEYAYDYGMPQWLSGIDHRLAPLHLEHLFLGRHKFYHFRIWYRDHLAPYVRDILLDSRTLSRPYLNRQRLEQIVHDHTTGRRNYTSEIHRLLTSELLHRTLLEPHL